MEANCVLRVYQPRECDSTPRHAPLDWEKCRNCEGGLVPDEEEPRRCGICAGFGSLKEAVRFALSTRVSKPDHEPCGGSGILREVWPPGDVGDECHCVTRELRCQNCSHPFSMDGTWVDPGGLLSDVRRRDLLCGWAGPEFWQWAERNGAVHYSPCDEECRHGEPGRMSGPLMSLRGEMVGRVLQKAVGYGISPMPTFEASWRSVDVRTLGWPHDLRREKLAVLCLRCYTKRCIGSL